jgi:hypothetical protein
MKAVWQGRMTRVAATYGEHAPMATACCNACRTCVQTNLLSAGMAAITGMAAVIVRVARRRSRRT